ncbi:ferrochelatase [Acidobacteria bacterium AH-259-D05]|nr:ferrochelatase [Acidobacteria bacterium AH-259-D05]
MESSVGALIMAYGSTPSLDDQDIFEYLRHILLHYRKTGPTQEEFQDLKERYQAIGGSPLYTVTERIVQAVQNTLNMKSPGRFQVHMAMKHSPPLIENVVREMANHGVSQAVGVALAPFRSRLSSDAYYRLVQEVNHQLDRPIQWSFAGDWNLHPLFLELWSQAIEDVLEGQDPIPMIIFTNHSLPARIQEWKDPYSDQFEKTAQALAEKCHLSKWTTAYQSEGGDNQSWLGPSLKAVLQEEKNQENNAFLVVPIGFVMDHLEILYDLDVKAQAEAETRGISMARTPMPNDHPLLVAMLADLITGTLPPRDEKRDEGGEGTCLLS